MTFCMINAIPLTYDYPKNWYLIAQLNFVKKYERSFTVMGLAAMHFFQFYSSYSSTIIGLFWVSYCLFCLFQNREIFSFTKQFYILWWHTVFIKSLENVSLTSSTSLFVISSVHKLFFNWVIFLHSRFHQEVRMPKKVVNFFASSKVCSILTAEPSGEGNMRFSADSNP